MIHRCPDKLYHLLHQSGNIFYLIVNDLRHLHGRKRLIIEYTVVICKRLHIFHDIVCIHFIFICQLTYNRHTVDNRIACPFDLLDRLYHTLQISLDRRSQCSIRFYQMFDCHIGAGITGKHNCKLQGTLLAGHEIHHSLRKSFVQITGNHDKHRKPHHDLDILWVFIKNQNGYNW